MRTAVPRSDKQTDNECPLDREAISSQKVEELEERKMKKVNWTAVVIVTIVALLVFQLAASLLGGWGYGGSRYGGWGMMGPGMMGGWGFSPFGWIGMAFMWLIPVGFIALLVLGIVWLARSLGGSTPPSPARTCPNCGRGIQADWKNCPYCGTALAK